MKKINRNFKKCFITGLTGSGGSYLCEHILKRDKNALMGIYPAEHLISQNEKYNNTN